MVKYIIFLTIATNICCTLEDDISDYVCTGNIEPLNRIFKNLKSKNINTKLPESGQTPLVTALSGYENEDKQTREGRNDRRADIVNIMLAIKDIDLEETGPHYKSPLWLACDAGNVPVIKILELHGANQKSINRAAVMNADRQHGARVMDERLENTEQGIRRRLVGK